jgi:hypothetical protein
VADADEGGGVDGRAAIVAMVGVVVDVRRSLFERMIMGCIYRSMVELSHE